MPCARVPRVLRNRGPIFWWFQLLGFPKPSNKWVFPAFCGFPQFGCSLHFRGFPHFWFTSIFGAPSVLWSERVPWVYGRTSPAQDGLHAWAPWLRATGEVKGKDRSVMGGEEVGSVEVGWWSAVWSPVYIGGWVVSRLLVLFGAEPPVWWRLGVDLPFLSSRTMSSCPNASHQSKAPT